MAIFFTIVGGLAMFYSMVIMPMMFIQAVRLFVFVLVLTLAAVVIYKTYRHFTKETDNG